ncbi:MAG: flagellar motor switch protein FliN [Pseudomonadota bacterium]
MSETDSGQAQAPAEDKVAPAAFDDLEQSTEGSGAQDINLDVVLNVDVDLSLEVGRASISVRNLLQLNQGSVVELDRLAGEPLDVLINGTLIARGEVVVVNDKYGIRLTDVISPAERIKRVQ